MPFAVEVRFPGPAAAAYDFLTEPTNRPQWQTGLRKVELLTDGPTGVGTRWYDVLGGGVRPLMEITEMAPHTTWAEAGRWHGVRAELRLDFKATDAGTLVRATVVVQAPGWRRPIGWGIALLGPTGIRNDLRAAARLLSH